MKRALVIVSVMTGLIVLGFLDYSRTPRKDSAAYAAGVADGEHIGRVHQQANSPKMDAKGIAATPVSRLPWSVKLNWPHAISEFSAGWADGYDQGYHYRQPWKITQR